eukprot:GHRR01033976.1.p1 GENE.GHRR01033976.1~~GHRR01033976.1.p1  ORF type:complete len:353 (+),score=108.19 GHRR01033976.1:879-1937(+)
MLTGLTGRTGGLRPASRTESQAAALANMPLVLEQQQAADRTTTFAAGIPSNSVSTSGPISKAVLTSDSSVQEDDRNKQHASRLLHPAPILLGVRGPGCVLGDDAMRERRLAVGVVAATQVVTLHIPPQKMLSALDSLTLRLFGRLRTQLLPSQQHTIQEALAETARMSLVPDNTERQHRATLLQQVYEGRDLPSTLLRPGHAEYDQVYGQTSSPKPAWRSLRSPEPRPQSAPASGGHSNVPKAGDVSSGVALPLGLTDETFAGLPQCESMQRLIKVITHADEHRQAGQLSRPQTASPTGHNSLNAGSRPASSSRDTVGLPKRPMTAVSRTCTHPQHQPVLHQNKQQPIRLGT